MFFSSERELKTALCDTLMRAAWYDFLSTMANCGKIVTFLCLGISIITWVIILKQLFASGSWILVNIPLDLVSGNIHQYSLRLQRIIVKYHGVLISNSFIKNNKRWQQNEKVVFRDYLIITGKLVLVSVLFIDENKICVFQLCWLRLTLYKCGVSAFIQR